MFKSLQLYSCFILGNDSNYQFQQCEKAFCNEKTIEIGAPMAQIILLLEKSPSCKQEIVFECQSAPVMVCRSVGNRNNNIAN